MKKHTLEQIYNKATEIYKIPTLSACYSEIDGTKLGTGNFKYTLFGNFITKYLFSYFLQLLKLIGIN